MSVSNIGLRSMRLINGNGYLATHRSQLPDAGESRGRMKTFDTQAAIVATG